MPGSVSALAAGILLLSSPVGWVVALAALGVAAGGIGTFVGGFALAGSQSGLITDEQAMELSFAGGMTMQVMTPGGLGGAIAGGVIGGDQESLETGAFVGGLAETAVALGYAGYMGVRGTRTGTRSGEGLRQTGGRGEGGFNSSDEAWAAKRYDEIRTDSGDVNRIADATGLRPENVQKVKEHVFLDEHLKDKYVDYGVPAEVGRFDPDPQQVEIWERLQSGQHTPEDIRWLKHEIAERKAMELSGSRSYGAAHDAASRRWPSPLR